MGQRVICHIDDVKAYVPSGDVGQAMLIELGDGLRHHNLELHWSGPKKPAMLLRGPVAAQWRDGTNGQRPWDVVDLGQTGVVFHGAPMGSAAFVDGWWRQRTAALVHQAEQLYGALPSSLAVPKV